MKGRISVKRLRFVPVFLLAFLLLFPAALSEPLPLLEDYADEQVIPYDENDPSAGSFSYSYHYPHVDPATEGGAKINSFYLDLATYTDSFTIPYNMDACRDMGGESSVVISYTVTCNSDDFFSVLLRNANSVPGVSTVSWEGHVFSRAEGKADSTMTLPQLLGILATDENDTWLQDRQTARAEKLIREMVWDRMRENKDGIPFYSDFVEEDLEHYFFPEEDFYLDETADPVFFLQPGIAAPESAGLIVVPLSLEEILDEM